MQLARAGAEIAQAAADVARLDARVTALVATGLPEEYGVRETLRDATVAGTAVDATDLALKEAAPRIASAGQTFERVSRAVRRTVALVQRIEAGWPRSRPVDDRQTMARRQVARGVGERIARHASGELAERLFDELRERLETTEFDGDLDQPVEVVIAAICRDLGLPEPGLETAPAGGEPGTEASAGDDPGG